MSLVLALLLGGYYGIYIALINAAIQVAVLFSLLVSADRVLNVLKYVVIKAKVKLTGRLPQHAWNFIPLPEDPLEFPKVSKGDGPSCGP